MQLVTILFGLMAVVFAVQQDKFRIPEETRTRINNISNMCAAETNVDSGLFPRLADGSLPNDDATKKYMHCFALKAGLIDETGHIIIEKFATLLENHPRVEEFKEAHRKCNEVIMEDPVATAAQMYKCYAETTPVLLVFE